MAIAQDKETALVERFQYAAIAEAGRLLDEGIATAKDIDLAMRAGAGLKTGPLEQADEIGLDTALASLRRLNATHGDN
ncbi:MAG: 3-hydroxyacyl-CoA dehydrogenase family protein, partial [Candidatus Eremiobacteraeota bacterium]|nr:3-hydroxyacyl-CoA dehydrogenase family protein [Candidatus Eremiobacteraeota bacterium]